MESYVQAFEDAATFGKAFIPFLEANEAETSVVLGRLASSLDTWRAPEYLFLGVLIGEQPSGCAFFSSRDGLLTRGTIGSIRQIVEKVAESGLRIPAIMGPADSVGVFTNLWCEISDCSISATMHQRLYELRSVTPVQVSRGLMRLATAEDTELLTKWTMEFSSEALSSRATSDESARKNVETKIDLHRIFVWEDAGSTVAMASISRPTRRTYSVNAVYTPAVFRGRGYATSLVSGVSQHVLDGGKEAAILYTDLSNPTSNSIYQKIGYRPICESQNNMFTYRS